MAKRAQAKESNAERKGISGALPPWSDVRRVIIGTLVAGAVLATALLLLVGTQRARQFLLTDERFQLTPPPQFEFISPNITVTGAKNAMLSSIHAVFQEDFGRSVYLLNLDEKRAQLRNVEWVKDATVTRLWPNRIAVQVVERRPVAFVELPASRNPSETEADPSAGARQFMLIDDEGYVLRPKPGVGYKLPVVSGIALNMDLPVRRDRIQRAMTVIAALKEKASSVVEIDVSDSNDVRVRREMSDHSVTLILGNRRFYERMTIFDENYPELQKFLPADSVLDLRLEDRITEVHDRANAAPSNPPPARPRKAGSSKTASKVRK